MAVAALFEETKRIFRVTDYNLFVTRKTIDEAFLEEEGRRLVEKTFCLISDKNSGVDFFRYFSAILLYEAGVPDLATALPFRVHLTDPAIRAILSCSEMSPEGKNKFVTGLATRLKGFTLSARPVIAFPTSIKRTILPADVESAFNLLVESVGPNGEFTERALESPLALAWSAYIVLYVVGDDPYAGYSDADHTKLLEKFLLIKTEVPEDVYVTFNKEQLKLLYLVGFFFLFKNYNEMSVDEIIRRRVKTMAGVVGRYIQTPTFLNRNFVKAIADYGSVNKEVRILVLRNVVIKNKADPVGQLLYTLCKGHEIGTFTMACEFALDKVTLAHSIPQVVTEQHTLQATRDLINQAAALNPEATYFPQVFNIPIPTIANYPYCAVLSHYLACQGDQNDKRIAAMRRKVIGHTVPEYAKIFATYDLRAATKPDSLSKKTGGGAQSMSKKNN